MRPVADGRAASSRRAATLLRRNAVVLARSHRLPLRSGCAGPGGLPCRSRRSLRRAATADRRYFAELGPDRALGPGCRGRPRAIAPHDVGGAASPTPARLVLELGLAATRPVTPRPSSPVCLACFAADRAAGRDGYCRASWRLPERCVCPAHGRMLIDQCPSCHGRLRVGFRLRENRARPVCTRCESALEGRAGEGDGLYRGLTTALLAMQTRVGAAVDHAPTCRGRLEEVVAALWSPLDDPGASRPVLALWVSERGWRAPVEARLAVGRPMPLRLLRVPFRGLTLVAIGDLFGEEFTALERARERAAWLFRRAAPRRPVPAKSPRPPALWPGGERRSPADYRLLAREILAHPDRAAATQLPERRRRRVLGRLIDAALAPASAT